MKGDSIIISGKLTKLSAEQVDFDLIMESNYIYAPIHALNYKPLHLTHTLELAERSYFALYGERFELDTKEISSNIERLLSENRYPMGSAVVVLYLLAGSKNKLRELNQPHHYILSCRQQLLYRGYTNWHSGAKAIIVPYEYPFSQHRTAVSLSSHTYAENYAKRQGYDAAIRENYEGVLMSVGDYPLFAVSGRSLITTPVACGLAENVEYSMIHSIAQDLSMEFCEVPLIHNQLRAYEELFYVTPQGVHHIVECDKILYPNIVARKIGLAMSKIQK